MPDVLPTINNEPAQGIQALLDTTYLWNPDVANDLIEQINALLEKLEGATGSIPPYSELEAPVKQYQPCYNGDNVYVAAADMETLPATFDPAQWILIATKAPVLQAGAGIDINGNEISVEQQVLSDAAAGGTAVQPEDLATVATSGSYTDLSNKPAIDGVTLTSQTTKADIGLAGVYRYKGSVATYADLANVQNPDVGDVYNVEDTGDNYAWSGTEWDQLGGTFVAPVTSVNSKTGAVVLSAKDVSAIPQYSTMPTVDSSILGETVQYVGATDANYTNGYFYKASGTAPSSPVFYYNNNDIEITDPTAFINTVNANVGGGLQVADGSLMQIDAHTDRNNDWVFDIYLENPNGSGGYTDTEYCGFTVASLASVGITESSPSMDRFSIHVAYTTSTEPQIYSSWPGGFLIVNPQQFISFASNILGGASPVGDTVSVWMAGSSGSETYDFVYVIGNDEGTIYQEDYTFTESEFESNLGLRILDPYAEVDFSPVTEGTTPTYAWVRVDVQPNPDETHNKISHTFMYDEDNPISIANIRLKEGETAKLKIRAYEAFDNGEGEITRESELFNIDVFLDDAKYLLNGDSGNSRCLFSKLEIVGYLFCDISGTYDGYYQLWSRCYGEYETDEKKYSIFEIEYSDGVDSFEFSAEEGSYIEVATGYTGLNPTGCRQEFPDFFEDYAPGGIMPVIESGGTMTWKRYPFGDIFTGWDNRILVTENGGFEPKWASQIYDMTIPEDQPQRYLDPVAIFQYLGETDQDYTQGYFYKIAAVGQRNATIISTQGNVLGNITIDQDKFADFLKSQGNYWNSSDYCRMTGVSYNVRWDFMGVTYTKSELEDIVGISYDGYASNGDYIEIGWDDATFEWQQVNTQPEPVIPDPLPSQTGNAGKFLTTDGTDASWATVDALPSQAGNAGKMLVTNGTTASWATPTTITFRTWGANE